MTITTTKSDLQTLHAAITGISSAPTAWPESELNTGNFPEVLVKKGNGFSKKVAGKIWGIDEWEIYLFLARKNQDNYAQANTDADTYVQRFRNVYADPDNFTIRKSPTFVQFQSFEEEAIRDTGLVELEFYSKEYYGVIFRIKILEKEL